MKKILKPFIIILIIFAVFGCSSKQDETPVEENTYTIAIPNDTTNGARALLLLEDIGIIQLKEGVGISATKEDIVENPYQVIIEEVEASQISNICQDVDFAIINSNYAIDAGLVPAKDALAQEDSFSTYANILAVKEGREEEPIIKALAAALESQEIADYITKTYNGGVVSVVETPTDGYDPSIDYEALAGKKVSVATSPVPHADILEIAKKILAEKDIEVEIVEFTDYVQPNLVVDSGDIDANYFQHLPYLEDFNAENGTKLVSVASIHAESMGIYAGKQVSLDVFEEN